MNQGDIINEQEKKAGGKLFQWTSVSPFSEKGVWEFLVENEIALTRLGKSQQTLKKISKNYSFEK